MFNYVQFNGLEYVRMNQNNLSNKVIEPGNIKIIRRGRSSKSWKNMIEDTGKRRGKNMEKM